MTQNRHFNVVRTWRYLLVLGIALCVLPLVVLMPNLTSSTELVRIRNALLLSGVGDTKFDWTPASVPKDFFLENGPLDPFFIETSSKLGLPRLGSDWEKVMAISQHLLSHPNLAGLPIQSDLRNTYRRIVADGDGYCGDFTRVFIALALVEGIPVRSWSFSLDGFGGHGHIWPEIWNRQAGKWQLVDIYNNYYFHLADGVPLSAMEFRGLMLNPTEKVLHSPLNEKARPGYQIDDKLWAWYRSGIHGWYMVWGNNVFTYDAAILKRHLGSISRSLAQLDAILQGAQPKLKLLADEKNANAIEKIWRFRSQLQASAIASMAGLLIVLVAGYKLRLAKLKA